MKSCADIWNSASLLTVTHVQYVLYFMRTLWRSLNLLLEEAAGLLARWVHSRMHRFCIDLKKITSQVVFFNEGKKRYPRIFWNLQFL
jgi:hypothetical protein